MNNFMKIRKNPFIFGPLKHLRSSQLLVEFHGYNLSNLKMAAIYSFEKKEKEEEEEEDGRKFRLTITI